MSYPQFPGSWEDPSRAAPNLPSSAPGHQGPPGYPPSASPAFPTAYDISPHTNKLAVASLVTSLCGLFLCGFPALIGAIMGHIARKQIRLREEIFHRLMNSPEAAAEGREAVMRIVLPLLKKKNGVALAGVIVGWIGFVLWLAIWIPVAWGFIEAATESTPS